MNGCRQCTLHLRGAFIINITLKYFINLKDKQPNKILSANDPGDDIQRRFRYQSTYSAILSLHMCKDDSPIEELYCELHEDILLKFKDGKFGGVQVKTRERHLGPLDLNCEEIKKALRRFVSLDLLFPSAFSSFTIATNAGFSKAKNKCIETIHGLAKNSDTGILLKNRSQSKSFIKQMAKQNSCSEEQVISVLGRLRLLGSISSMEDIKTNLTQKVADILNLKGHTLGVIDSIVDKLILRHIDAASLSNGASHSEYFVLSNDPKDEAIGAIIQNKRLTKQIVFDIVKQQLSEPITLFIKDSGGIPKSSGSAQKLATKMDAGGISLENIDLAKDQKYSFEALTLTWLYKYPEDEANKRYDQVISIVKNQCQESFDEAAKDDQLFGIEMLKLTRAKIRARFNGHESDFFDCKYEHLLGVAGVLTEDCKVWWSKHFSI